MRRILLGEKVEQGADGFPNVFWRSLLGFSEQLFELCEDLLDRIEIGRILRQEEAPQIRMATSRRLA